MDTRNKQTAHVHVSGPPGSGKTTLASRLAELLGYFIIDTGKIIREEKRKPELVAAGKLIDDDSVLEIVRREIAASNGRPIVYIGVPRTVKQAKEFFSLLRAMKIELIVGHLEVPIEECARRILSSPADRQERPDNNKPVLQTRFEEEASYFPAVWPIIHRESRKIVHLDAMKRPDELYRDLAYHLQD